MMDSKRIKCPKCQGMLQVTNSKQQPVVLVACPKCGVKMRVKFDTGETVLASASDSQDLIGCVRVNGRVIPLQEGRNTIGRKSSSSEATIQIDTDDLTMSRLHAELNVVRLKSGRVKVVLGDLRQPEKAAQKPIVHEDISLDVEDRIDLCPGDIFILGNTRAKYMIESVNS
ncbi:MAG: hypothetical protein J6Y97_09405 [Prevotella sp.]|nr:hypothetical protein [Prevotella sp.]MBP5506395.1 hypothetical protein [Prevotella sp.]